MMMSIKKIINRASSSLAVVALALGLSPVIANAAGPGTATSNLTTVSTGYVANATSNAEATSNAQFSVTPGMLTLNDVPNILLSNTSISDLANADAKLQLASGPTVGGVAYDGNNSGNLNITDYRGSHAGWSLTVGMSPFTSLTSAATITGTTMNLAFTPNSLANTETPDPTTVALTPGTVTGGWISNPTTLWNAPANTGEGSNSATLNNNTSLNIGKTLATSGTYDSTLFWALQDAPVATVAS